MLSRKDYLKRKRQKEGKDTGAKVNIQLTKIIYFRNLAWLSKVSGGFGTPDLILGSRASQTGYTSQITSRWPLRSSSYAGSKVERKRSFPEFQFASIT